MSFLIRFQHRQNLGRAKVYSLSLKVNQVQLPQVWAGVRLYPNSPPKNVNPWIPTCARYLLNNAKYLKYDDYLKAGFPMATGVIEGACPHLIKDRMDITGARWTMRGAEAVLPLGSLYISGDWDEYWQAVSSTTRT